VYAYAILERYHIPPSDFARMSDKEKALLIAMFQTAQEAEEKENKKLKKK
jgi:hypothetical protein